MCSGRAQGVGTGERSTMAYFLGPSTRFLLLMRSIVSFFSGSKWFSLDLEQVDKSYILGAIRSRASGGGDVRD